MKLYEYDQRIEEVLAAGVSKETGEISEECIAALDELEIDKKAKCLAVAAAVKGMRAEGDAVTNEAEKLCARAQIHFNQAERLLKYLAAYYDSDSKPIADARCQLRWQQNPAKVLIQEERLLPKRYLTVVPRSTKPDKKAIGVSLKAGKKVAGAILHSARRLVLK